MNYAFRSFMFLTASALVIGATACSSSPKASDESAAATSTPAPVIADTTPAPTQTPVIAQNDSKTKGLWGASSTGRSR